MKFAYSIVIDVPSKVCFVWTACWIEAKELDFDGNVLILEFLNEQEIVSSLNNRLGKSEENDNSEEEDTLNKNIFITSVCNVIKILSNSLALNNDGSKIDFIKLEK